MTVGQGHDTPLGHGQQLNETLLISNITKLWPGQGLWLCVNCDLDL